MREPISAIRTVKIAVYALPGRRTRDPTTRPTQWKPKPLRRLGSCRTCSLSLYRRSPDVDAGVFLEETAIDCGRLDVKTDEQDCLNRYGVFEHLVQGNARGPLLGKPIDAGADGGKCDASGAQMIRKFQRTPVAGRKQFI